MIVTRHPRASRSAPRRRVVVLNRVEDRVSGRVAFVIHRGRRQSRLQAEMLYRSLEEWAAIRQQRLQDDDPHGGADEVDRDATDDVVDGPERQNSSEPAVTGEVSDRQEPTEDWTKGELYERARELEIDGRSRMNKAELLEEIRNHDRQEDPE